MLHFHANFTEMYILTAKFKPVLLVPTFSFSNGRVLRHVKDRGYSGWDTKHQANKITSGISIEMDPKNNFSRPSYPKTMKLVSSVYEKVH